MPARPVERGWNWRTAAAAAAVLAAVQQPSGAGAEPDTDAALSPRQRQAVEALIGDYIRQNPQVIIDAVTRHQAQLEEAERRDTEAALVLAKAELKGDASTPVAGNPNGDVTIVEFFDYQCGYCKKVVPSIQSLLKSDGNIRYVFKEYPILGPQSVTAARAALAVWAVEPQKYFDFHAALMAARGSLTVERALDIAASVGIDRNRIRKAMDDPAIETALQNNYALGRRLGIQGTPAFIVGGRVVPGAVDLQTLKELVADARKG